MKTTYLSITQVLVIHDQMIKRFGGSSGIRDLGLIQSAVGRPKVTFDNRDLYITIFDKAAALLESLLMNHPFVDGNKRTAVTSVGIFFQLNGYKLKNYHDEEIAFALEVANKHLDVKQISKWLEEHVDQI